MHRVGMFNRFGHNRMPGLMKGDDFFLLSIHHPVLFLKTRNHPVDGLVEIHQPYLFFIISSSQQRGFIDKVGQIGSDLDGPVQSAIFDEQLQLLADALFQLPLEQRETIILHLNGGMKFNEIAQMQHIPINTVQGRYRYGLNKLRTILSGESKK